MINPLALLTIAEFRHWLMLHLDSNVGITGLASNCPVAMYLREALHYKGGVTIGWAKIHPTTKLIMEASRIYLYPHPEDETGDESYDFQGHAPLWVSLFVNAIDKVWADTVTGRQALEVLDQVEARVLFLQKVAQAQEEKKNDRALVVA